MPLKKYFISPKPETAQVSGTQGMTKRAGQEMIHDLVE